MNEVFIIEKEFLFKNNVHEITSISIENNYDIVGSICEGEFILSGDYKLHEVSINKEDFSFKIPFKVSINSNVNLDSVEVEITDFSYEFNKDVLAVNVEYNVHGEQSLIEFAEEADLEEFLQKNNDTEVIELSEKEKVEEPYIFTEVDETLDTLEMTKEVEDDVRKFEDIKGHKILKKEEIIVLDTIEDNASVINKDTIIDNINSEESFVTYHVHTVTPSDTIDSICNMYDINLNDLKKFNNLDELSLNMKLIIPDEEN